MRYVSLSNTNKPLNFSVISTFPFVLKLFVVFHMKILRPQSISYENLHVYVTTFYYHISPQFFYLLHITTNSLRLFCHHIKTLLESRNATFDSCDFMLMRKGCAIVNKLGGRTCFTVGTTD